MGNVPELGSWLIEDGLVLSPTPGSSNLNMHSAVVQLPADTPVEAKVRGACMTPRVAGVLRMWAGVLHNRGSVVVQLPADMAVEAKVQGAMLGGIVIHI